MITVWLRQLLLAALILTYALLAHYSNAAHAAALGAVLAAAPLLLALLLLARRAPSPRLSACLVLLLSGAVLLHYWPLIERKFSLLYLLQQCGVYLMLAAGFGRSLMPGQEPLCTQWAQRLRGTLSQDVRRYTRRVTVAWTAFFVIIATTSVALYVAASLRVWSLFSNFLTLPLVVLMFIGEYSLRHRLVPSLRRVGLLDTVRAYWVFGRSGTAPRS